MNNVINLTEKQQEYKENVRRLNKNSIILKVREIKNLVKDIEDLLVDPEDK